MPTPTIELPAKLMPAKPADVRAGLLPRLPEWFPLDREPRRDETGEILETFPPYTDAERRRLRIERAVDEAVRGPYDGMNVMVTFEPAVGPPRLYAPVNTPDVWYRLDEEKSTRTRLFYRYALDSPIHPATMRAVEEGFDQAGRDYAVAAREEANHERTDPTA